MLKSFFTPKGKSAKPVAEQAGANDAAAKTKAKAPRPPKKKATDAPPKADTLDLVPILAIAPPYLVTKDGTFIMMFEIPPLESGASDRGAERALWSARYGQALSALPSGLKFQMSVILEPCNPTDDLAYFISRAERWHYVYGDPERTQSERATAKSMAIAGDYISELIQKWYDHFLPINMRTIITISYTPVGQAMKAAAKSMFGGKSKDSSMSLDQLEGYLKQATVALEEKAGFLMHAFQGSSIPLRVLTPAEMCQVVWRTLHPTASGAKNLSAANVVERIANGAQLDRYGGMPPEDAFTPDLAPSEIAELLAPDTLVESEDYFEVDGVLISGYVVWDYRPNRPAMVGRLADLEGGWCGTLFVEVADPAVVADKLRQREVQLSATAMAKSSKGLIADFGSGQENAAVQNARYQLETATVTPIYIRFFVFRTANDLETLRKRQRELETLFSTTGIAAFPARYGQSLLYQSYIPADRLVMGQKSRNMTPESLAAFFWPEHRRVLDPEGIYVGMDLDTRQPVRIDPFGVRSDKTPSYLGIGRPGAGKSVWLRSMMLSVMLAGGKVMAIDLEGEMKGFTQTYGGRYIEVGTTTGERINILDIPPDSDDPLLSGVEHLVSFCGSVNDKVIPHGPEWNALADAYRDSAIDHHWISEEGKVGEYRHEDAPRLADIVRFLDQQNTNQGVGRSIADMLRPYSHGVYAHYFNSRTTFDIRNESLVVFGLRHVNNDQSSHLLRVYLWQVLGLIWGEVLRRHDREPDVANHIMLDEVWKLLAAPGGGQAIENMARRFRKRKAALWMATQEVGEFVDSEQGRKILSIVGNTFLMDQRPHEAGRLRAALGLSDGLARHLTGLGTGRGILLTPNANLMLQVVVPDGWNVMTNV